MLFKVSIPMGKWYEFMAIESDAMIRHSCTYDIFSGGHEGGGLKTIFNFTVTTLETASKSTPHALPTKPRVVRNAEIGEFNGDFWVKACEMSPPEILDENEGELVEMQDTFFWVSLSLDFYTA